jgi:predicted nucleic acid-binding protein
MIFIDTGAFCAFSDRSDNYHEIAVRQFSLILKEKHPLVTTNFIVDETYTWLRYRLGFNQAIEFLHRIRQAEKEKPRLEIITIGRPTEERAARLLEKYADQDLSFTDATSLAIIQERKLKQAFTFDRHFYLLPIELIPGIVNQK